MLINATVSAAAVGSEFERSAAIAAVSTVVVSAVPPAGSPTMSEIVIVAPSTVVWLVDTDAGTLYWAVSSSATPLNTSQIQSGVGLPFGTLTIASGSASGAVDLSTASSGDYYFHAYATNGAGSSSVLVSEVFYWSNP